ncbi:MAG: hypothetical protein H6510_01580 [Acidobacteria bacterium]|nr:hypothetical protein [Acidobacteriota bacterium]
MRYFLLITLGACVYAQSVANIYVYEETTGNLPGPFTGMNIPIGVWHLLQYSGMWGGGINPPPPPPPNGCTAGGNGSMYTDEVLMFEDMNSNTFAAAPCRGRWGNYFSASFVAVRAQGESWSNPKLEAQSNYGQWEFFSSLFAQGSGQYVSIVGDFNSNPNNSNGVLTLRGELRLRCGSQSPYIVSQTYTLQMGDPKFEMIGEYLYTDFQTRLSSWTLGDKTFYEAGYWPVPYEIRYPNFIVGGTTSDITISDVINQAPPSLALTEESIIEAGRLVLLGVGTYPVYGHVDREGHVFDIQNFDWLGQARVLTNNKMVFVDHDITVDTSAQ